MRCDGLRLVEDRKAQDTARLHALREAAHIGMVDTDAGCFRSFESPAALIRDLTEIADEVINGKRSAKRTV
ncbi:MAG: hypothetical protein J0L95_15455 [Candidatus Accumulibacter sp.]|uniref:hypothetical protein n=1 Tax=Accumulibacter sp. TaxID=2053492 RepID=UPI001AC4809E|nr:hypothetical protein [Accumulibacter sp.]MBN8439423.1 hypothetical protein [Accumulibacter sp.]